MAYKKDQLKRLKMPKKAKNPSMNEDELEMKLDELQDEEEMDMEEMDMSEMMPEEEGMKEELYLEDASDEELLAEMKKRGLANDMEEEEEEL